ncbi:MAG TPA: rhomboid family intramembrane serine protease [Chitinophagaceae bacterium]|nr:rhomboid family intramembrane serine protease [Chitinophagaceae bacterium]
MNVTVVIIIITGLISLTAFYKEGEMEKLLFWPAIIKEKKQYYRFLTSGFVHGGWMHLIFNMITLYYFGRIAEQVLRVNLGSGYYIGLYILSMIAADLPTYFKYRNNYEYRALGASGAVSGVLFSSILFAPWSKIYIFLIPIGIPAFIFGGLFLLFCLYMDKKGGGNINHNAHFWGAICGVIYTIVVLPEIVPHFVNALLSGG